MDLGLKDSAAVVTGGTKGMGRAIAEAFADDGARVAVLARGTQAHRRDGRGAAASGSPDAVGLSVDLTDPAAIDAAFADIGERWGAINSLVNTVGPADGYFEDMADDDWDAAFQLGPHGRGALHPGCAAAAAGCRVGPHRELRGPLDPAPEPADRRLHGLEGGACERVEEPGEEPGARRDPGEHDQPGHDRHRQLHRGARTPSSRPTASTRAIRSTS